MGEGADEEETTTQGEEGEKKRGGAWRGLLTFIRGVV